MKNHLNVLLADDDIDDFMFFKEALEELPLSTHLTIMQDGEKLMNLLMNETISLPHVLFLDLNMPRKNGFECLSEIKLNDRLKDLMVIILSTSFEEDAVSLLYETGAQYIIRKPPRISQFKKIVQQAITAIEQKKVLHPTRESFVLT